MQGLTKRLLMKATPHMPKATRTFLAIVVSSWMFAQDDTGLRLIGQMTAEAQQTSPASDSSAEGPNVALAIKPGFDVTQVNGFIHYLYYQYSNGDHPPPPLKPEQIYDPYLLALVLQDRAVAEAPGHAPLLDVDPICLCQDFDALQVTSVNIVHQDPFDTVAQVTFKDDGNTGKETYDLVRYGNRWFVHDILGGTAPSLLTYLVQGLTREGVTPPKDTDAPSIVLPGLTAMAETEGKYSATWWFAGAKGEGYWNNGALASMNLKTAGNSITINRLDLPQYNGFSIEGGGLTAVYTGTRSADLIDNGTAIWTFTNGQKVSGTWRANFIRPTVGAIIAEAKAPFSGPYSFDAYSNAVNWLQGGASVGNSELEADAAILYLNFVVPLTAANETKARNLLLDAAAQGNVEAEINLAQLNEFGRHGVKPDALQAEVWFSKAGPTGEVMLAEAKALAAHDQAIAAALSGAVGALTNTLYTDMQACWQNVPCHARWEQQIQEQHVEEEQADEHAKACRDDPAGCD